MSQTVTQKQCTESKTGLGAQVHTQRTLAGRKVRPSRGHRGRIVERSGIVSWPSTGRVAACGRPCHRRASLCRAPAWPYRSTGSAVYQHCIATRPTAKPLPPCHDTIDCIVTRPQPDCLLVTIQRLYHDTTPQRPAPRLCHDTILCIATQSTSQAARAGAASRIAGLAAR